METLPWVQCAQLRNTYEEGPNGYSEETPKANIAVTEQQIQKSIENLQPMDMAQTSEVLRLPGFLGASELQEMLRACTTIEEEIGTVGRWGSGGWQTCYLVSSL
jgi:hypothetical protein